MAISASPMLQNDDIILYLFVYDYKSSISLIGFLKYTVILFHLLILLTSKKLFNLLFNCSKKVFVKSMIIQFCFMLAK